MKLEDCIFLNLPPQRKIRTREEDQFGYLLWQRKIKEGKYRLRNSQIKQRLGIDIENLQPSDNLFLVGLPTWYMHLSPILEEEGILYGLVEIQSMEPEELNKTIPESNTYLLSPITNTTPIAFEVIDFLKRNCRASKIIVGGPQATYEGDEFLQRGADVVVRGEGELIFRELVSGRNLDEIFGISFMQGGIIIRNPLQRPIANLDELPSFKWTNIPKEYDPSFYRRYFSQRGCPMNCCFCADVLWANQRVRRKSLERVREEVRDTIENTQFLEFHFADNCFSADRNYARGLAEVLSEFCVDWTAETRVDMVDKESLKYWSSYGCVELEYGGESAVNEVLIQSNKRITREQMVKAFQMTKDAGICVHTNWMVGLPGETRESAIETIDFVYDITKKGLIDTMDYFIMVPYPGSPVARNPVKFGIEILTKNWRQYNEDLLPVYQSETFSREEIFKVWKYGIQRFAEALS